MVAVSSDTDVLEGIVSVMAPEELRIELLACLNSYPKEREVFVRKYVTDNSEAYERSLRTSLEDLVDELAYSIEADEFTPYWKELELTREGYYLDQRRSF